MAKQLLHGLGGLVWNEQVSKPLHIEPGGTTTTGTFTPTVICSGGTEPSLVVTVSDVGGAPSSITWCGKTWGAGGEPYGTSQEVCPTHYGKYQNGPQSYNHIWYFVAPYTEIKMRRGAVYDAARNRLYFGDYDGGIFPLLDERLSYASVFNVGVLTTGSALPTYNNYTITDNFFGSYTTGSVTYTWAKGTNW